jgi:crotonobetainyl-CoA:carnitine CoA-transferase CaiB-like acyl-CoA transferase
VTEHPAVGDCTTGALSGLLVADFSRVLAGPYLTMMLADLGATVIKVESPDGDQTRQWGPPWHGGQSTYYAGLNRGKKSVVLDLTTAEDRALAATLARRADVVVENLMPERMRIFGLDYPAVAATNERLIYCSFTGFGAQPEAASVPGFDLIAQATSGLMSITGDPGGPPTKVGVAVVDVLCGLHAGMGVLAALAARERTGRGQLVQVNLLLSALSGLANQASGFLATGAVPSRLGNAHPSVAPYEIFVAGDGEVVIAVGTDRQFARLCEALDLYELAADPRFVTNATRVENRDSLRRAIDSRLAVFSRDAALDLLTSRGVPCGPVNRIDEAFAYADLLDADVLWDVGGVPQVRSPFFLGATPPKPQHPSPALNEMGAEIREWLGRGGELR